MVEDICLEDKVKLAEEGRLISVFADDFTFVEAELFTQKHLDEIGKRYGGVAALVPMIPYSCALTRQKVAYQLQAAASKVVLVSKCTGTDWIKRPGLVVEYAIKGDEIEFISERYIKE